MRAKSNFSSSFPSEKETTNTNINTISPPQALPTSHQYNTSRNMNEEIKTKDNKNQNVDEDNSKEKEPEEKTEQKPSSVLGPWNAKKRLLAFSLGKSTQQKTVLEKLSEPVNPLAQLGKVKTIPKPKKKGKPFFFFVL